MLPSLKLDLEPVITCYICEKLTVVPFQIWFRLDQSKIQSRSVLNMCHSQLSRDMEYVLATAMPFCIEFRLFQSKDQLSLWKCITILPWLQNLMLIHIAEIQYIYWKRAAAESFQIWFRCNQSFIYDVCVSIQLMQLWAFGMETLYIYCK